jgi:ribosomal protein S18 acetylase RimI-like enzyme
MKIVSEVEITQELREPRQLEAAAHIFYRAFALKLDYLELFSKSPAQAERILMRSFRQDCALYALEGGEVVGVLGLQRSCDTYFLNISWPVLKSEFGRWGAMWRLAWLRLTHWTQWPHTGELRIEALAVAEKMRGQGVGTCLVERAGQMARAAGCTALVLEVIDTNPSARRLYERLGFQVLRSDWLGPITARAGFSRLFYMRKLL